MKKNILLAGVLLAMFGMMSCYYGKKVTNGETNKFYFGLYVADSFYTDNKYYKYYLYFDEGNVVYYKLTTDDCDKVFRSIEYKHHGIAKYNIRENNLRLVFSERIVGSPESFPPPNDVENNKLNNWGFDGIIKKDGILMSWRNLNSNNDVVAAARYFKLCRRAERKNAKE